MIAAERERVKIGDRVRYLTALDPDVSKLGTVSMVHPYSIVIRWDNNPTWELSYSKYDIRLTLADPEGGA
jgi:hypothetical protein